VCVCVCVCVCMPVQYIYTYIYIIGWPCQAILLSRFAIVFHPYSFQFISFWLVFSKSYQLYLQYRCHNFIVLWFWGDNEVQMQYKLANSGWLKIMYHYSLQARRTHTHTHTQRFILDVRRNILKLPSTFIFFLSSFCAR